MSTRLSTASSKRSVTVSPSVATIRPGYCPTNFSTSATDSCGTTEDALACRLPKEIPFRGQIRSLGEIRAHADPMAKTASAKATAMPPSETSRAEWIRPRCASSARQRCRLASNCRSRLGGVPQSAERTFWRTPRSRTPACALRVAEDRCGSQQQNGVACAAKIRAYGFLDVIEDAHDPDHRSGIDALAAGLVVQRDIAAGMGFQRNAAAEMPSIASESWAMISGFSGLPKLRQLVAATGVAPVQATLRAASATACEAPSLGSR